MTSRVDVLFGYMILHQKVQPMRQKVVLRSKDSAEKRYQLLAPAANVYLHFRGVLVQQYTSANSFTESHILAQYHLQSSTKVILLLVAIGKFGKSGIKEKDCKVI
jgi:hypothetical protein